MGYIVFGLLALPENIKDLIEIGRWIRGRVKSFQNAPELLQELTKFGHDLYSGHLRLQIDVASALILQSRMDSQRILANGYVDKLLEISERAQAELNKSFNENGAVQRLYFARSGERHVKSILKDLARTQVDFQAFITCSELYARILAEGSQKHLTRDRFSIFGRYETDDDYCFGRKKSIRLAKGEFRSSGASYDSIPEEVTVLLERQDPSDRDLEEVRKTAEEISKMLDIVPRGSDRSTGVMQCLGYRTEPSLDLVFRVPSNLSDSIATTLQYLIAHRSDVQVEEQLQITYKISAAVAVVHAAQFVQKNIRPDTIIVFRETLLERDAPTSSRYQPFLSEWSLLRSGYALTTKSGSEAWIENMYRHPSRQGIHPESRYNMGHDIYSLGVILLEIGLWEPLILWWDGSPLPSRLYWKAGERIGCVSSSGDENDEIKMKSMLKPANVQRILVEMAQGDLANYMKESYVNLVQLCLTCVEKGVDGHSWKGDNLEVGDRFQRTVVGPLFKML
ncbi:hypothetical protein BDV97DRAFT_365156 [Delphinella strobiligena]|nr:hypothetical protein BDV97DRAFT_365156 [Delphinella strobiligena]